MNVIILFMLSTLLIYNTLIPVDGGEPFPSVCR